LVALEAVLSELDCRIIKARSGEEALRILLEKEVALILLDVHMPRMDGYETAALIRQRGKTRHIPIIFLTASYENADPTKGYTPGALDYMIKPLVVPQILEAKVARLS